MISGAGLFFVSPDRYPRSSSPAQVSIAPPPFGPFQHMPRGNGFLNLLIEVDAHPPRTANPSPLAHHADIPEQPCPQGKPIEPRHVARRFNAMEVDHIFVLHDWNVARLMHAVQRVL